MQKFVGKTIWIIGATDGIGKAVLKNLIIQYKLIL